MARQSDAYSRTQIVLHWLIASLVLFQLIFGESMTRVVDAAEAGGAVEGSDQALSTAHYWCGVAILALVSLRLVLRLSHGAPVSIGRFAWAAKLVHTLFYVLLFAIPLTGLLAVYVSDEFGDIHGWGKPAMIALIAIHAAAALWHHFWYRDATLRRMLAFAGRN